MVQARSRRKEPESPLVDLGDIVDEALATVKPQAAEKQIELKIKVTKGCLLRGDHGRLLQVLNNLLTNAFKFTPQGGEVSLGLERTDGEAVLTVSDTGIGIPLEDRPHVFERFFRSSNVDQNVTPGIGIGLSITKEIVESQGGGIVVGENKKGGAEFVVRLPLELAAVR